MDGIGGCRDREAAAAPGVGVGVGLEGDERDEFVGVDNVP
jgi:hypothetical protein